MQIKIDHNQKLIGQILYTYLIIISHKYNQNFRRFISTQKTSSQRLAIKYKNKKKTTVSKHSIILNQLIQFKYIIFCTY